jgi:hypothetical protein
LSVNRKHTVLDEDPHLQTLTHLPNHKMTKVLPFLAELCQLILAHDH